VFTCSTFYLAVWADREKGRSPQRPKPDFIFIPAFEIIGYASIVQFPSNYIGESDLYSNAFTA
jgi:hypothetical protein